MSLPAPKGGGLFYFYPKYSCIKAACKSSCFSKSRRSIDLCPPPRSIPLAVCLSILVRPLGGGGPRSGGGGIPAFLYFFVNLYLYPFKSLPNITIGKSENHDALIHEIQITFRIIQPALFFIVLAAVGFDSQPGLLAIKIQNIIAYDSLTLEARFVTSQIIKP